MHLGPISVISVAIMLILESLKLLRSSSWHSDLSLCTLNSPKKKARPTKVFFSVHRLISVFKILLLSPAAYE